MDLNLNQLRAFYYAAKCASITVAAEKLFVTQPAVSMQIRALEVQYEVILFDRRKKKLALTQAGRQLYELADRIFGLVEQAEQLLAGSGLPPRAVLRIGSTKTLVRYLLARHISKFRESYPGIPILIDEGSSSQMVRSVIEKRNDLAIVGKVEYGDEIEMIPFDGDELVLLASPSHPLARREMVSIADLKHENLILRENGSAIRCIVERVLRENGVECSAFLETGNVDFIKELVQMGNGVALIARMGVDRDIAAGNLTIIPVLEGPFYFDIDIVVNKERGLTPTDQAFLGVLMQESKYREGGQIDPDIDALDAMG